MDAIALETYQKHIQYEFSDLSLFETALTHSSVAPSRIQSNERMEFLGDAVLGLTVCGWLYENQPDMLEGEMTKIKSLVVSRHVCAEMAEEIGISEMLILGKGMSQTGDLPKSVSAAVFEAIVGAIYLDGGMGPAKEFIIRHIEPRILEAIEDEHKRNYKSILQQCAQRQWNTTPDYQLLDEKGPDHKKCFEIAVALAGKHFPSAWGMTKKDAEQQAARLALLELGMIDPEDEEEMVENGTAEE